MFSQMIPTRTEVISSTLSGIILVWMHDVVADYEMQRMSAQNQT